MARNLFKLMAIKDEYEVARLYTDGSFAKQLSRAVPVLRPAGIPSCAADHGPARRGRKAAQVEFRALDDEGFRLLAALKGLRGTALDLFGYTAERRMEKALLAQYEGDLDLIERSLAPEKIEAAAALASVPALIRGYGHVKQANAEKAAGERARLVDRLTGTLAKPVLQAAE